MSSKLTISTWVSGIGVLGLVLLLLTLHLGFGLIVGLTLYTLTRAVWRKLPNSWPDKLKKGIALTFLGTLISVLFVGANFGLKYAMHLYKEEGPQMLGYMLTSLKDLAHILPASLSAHLPQDLEGMHLLLGQAGQFAGQHALNVGGISIHFMFQFLFALIIAATLSTQSGGMKGTAFKEAWLSRLSEYSHSFSQLMSAQMYVAIWNAFCTTVFVYVVLPSFGVNLSFRESLIGFTLVISLIPALGNMIANSVMACLCIPHGVGVLLGAVVFLILVHKAEYLINAKVIGKNVEASIPEMLMAIIIGETLFGLPGLMLGPVTYAYIKTFLKAQKIV